MLVIKQYYYNISHWQLAGWCSLSVSIYYMLHYPTLTIKEFCFLWCHWKSSYQTSHERTMRYQCKQVKVLIFGCGRQIREFYLLSSMFGLTLWFTVEAYMAKQLTAGIPDQEVCSWSLTHRVVSLDKRLNST